MSQLFIIYYMMIIVVFREVNIIHYFQRIMVGSMSFRKGTE